MRLGTPHIRRWAWLACFAILVNALAPAISHAVASLKSNKQDVVEVCTAYGVVLVAVGDGAADRNPRGHSLPAGAACPYCVTHAGSFALPFGSSSLAVTLSPGTIRPLPPDEARPRGLAWTTPRSRAPPHFA